MSEMNCLWEIMVPCVSNDGKPFRTRHHREWDRQVRAITGGLTVQVPAKGQWVDEETDTLYQERVIPVKIVATETQMKEIAVRTLNHYDQLAVLYYKISSEAYIVRKSD